MEIVQENVACRLCNEKNELAEQDCVAFETRRFLKWESAKPTPTNLNKLGVSRISSHGGGRFTKSILGGNDEYELHTKPLVSFGNNGLLDSKRPNVELNLNLEM